MHNEPDVHPFSKKPSIIHTYNSTKGGVDSLDQLCSNMSCNRKTKRWPLCFFYNIINIACVNAFVIYKHNFYRVHSNKKPLNRIDFMIKLMEQLTEEWKGERLSYPNISKSLRQTILAVKTTPPTVEVVPEKQGKRKYCGLCPSSIRRYTTTYCDNCKTPICGAHQIKFCPTCKT